MPYKFEYQSKRIPQSHDRRVKLSDNQKQEIVNKYNTGRYTYKELASTYNVSVSTIRLTLHPEYTETRKVSGTKKRDKDKVKSYMANHRAYKKSLEQQGILIEKK